MLRREGQRRGCRKQVRFQLPTRDWREEREWERREALAAKLPASAELLGGCPCVVEERGQMSEADQPAVGPSWWRRLLTCLRRPDKPCGVKTAPWAKEVPFAEPVYARFDVFSLFFERF